MGTASGGARPPSDLVTHCCLCDVSSSPCAYRWPGRRICCTTLILLSPVAFSTHHLNVLLPRKPHACMEGDACASSCPRACTAGRAAAARLHHQPVARGAGAVESLLARGARSGCPFIYASRREVMCHNASSLTSTKHARQKGLARWISHAWLPVRAGAGHACMMASPGCILLLLMAADSDLIN